MNITSNKSWLVFYALFLYTRIMIFFSLIISFFEIKKQRFVLFNSYSGKSKDAILDYLYDNYNGNLEIKRVGVDCSFYSPKFFLLLAKSKFWITNVSMLYTTSWKPKNCFYVNLWHGTPIVKIGNEVSKKPYYNFQNVDFFPISSVYEKKLYHKSLNVNIESLIFAKNLRRSYLELTSHLKLKPSKKYLFYAPSWRNKNFSKMVLPLDLLKEFSEKLGLELVLSIHHKVKDEINIPNGIRILDSSECRELVLLNTKVFISDYSSLLTDALRNNCEIMLFIPDFDHIDTKRGFVFDKMKSWIYENADTLFLDLKLNNFSRFNLKMEFDNTKSENSIEKTLSIINE